MPVLAMNSLDLQGKRVLIRLDLNVPVRDGQVQSSARIDASLPSIRLARESGAKVMLMSHMGRPEEGVYDPAASLQPVADYLEQALGCPVSLVTDYLESAPEIGDGDVALLENVRFNSGEKADDEALARRYAGLCDVFVMDAFGTAHRAQASTHGVARFAPIACAGPLLTAELEALGRALEEPRRPLVAIVGGAKVSTKLTVLEAMLEKVDRLIPGGGIANTFIAACGHGVGQSLYEPDLVDEARKLMAQASARGGEIPVPTDVVVGKAFSADTPAVTRSVEAVADDEFILDIGPETAERYARMMHDAGTVVWNGPVGVFEFEAFSGGTQTLGAAIAASEAFSIAGGGDTLAAIDRFGLREGMSYISTGGGAFLEFLEGRTLPAVDILERRAAS